MIVVVIVPIVFAAPAIAFDVPPVVAVLPTIFASFAQFVPRMIGLFALKAVMLNGFVESVVRLDDASLAIISLGRRSASKKRQARS